MDEKEGTTAAMEFLYHDRQTHVIYGDWRYSGPLMVRPVNGRCLGILKTSYLRDNDGHCYVTSRLDAFLSVEPGGVELLTKVFHPLVEKTADGNFTQAVAFVGSLSRTAEVNSRGFKRLAAKLTHVQPEVRQELIELAAGMSEKSSPLATRAALGIVAAGRAARRGRAAVTRAHGWSSPARISLDILLEGEVGVVDQPMPFHLELGDLRRIRPAGKLLVEISQDRGGVVPTFLVEPLAFAAMFGHGGVEPRPAIRLRGDKPLVRRWRRTVATGRPT